MRVSQTADAGVVSAEFTSPMKKGLKYMLTSTVPCWFRVSTTGTAAVAEADNAVYLPADTPVGIGSDDDAEGYVSVIRSGLTSGVANLVLLER